MRFVYSINCLLFVNEKQCIFCEVWTGYLGVRIIYLNFRLRRGKYGYSNWHFHSKLFSLLPLIQQHLRSYAGQLPNFPFESGSVGIPTLLKINIKYRQDITKGTIFVLMTRHGVLIHNWIYWTLITPIKSHRFTHSINHYNCSAHKVFCLLVCYQSLLLGNGC
jgi:hypothetical protein